MTNTIKLPTLNELSLQADQRFELTPLELKSNLFTLGGNGINVAINASFLMLCYQDLSSFIDKAFNEVEIETLKIAFDRMDQDYRSFLPIQYLDNESGFSYDKDKAIKVSEKLDLITALDHRNNNDLVVTSFVQFEEKIEKAIQEIVKDRDLKAYREKLEKEKEEEQAKKEKSSDAGKRKALDKKLDNLGKTIGNLAKSKLKLKSSDFDRIVEKALQEEEQAVLSLYQSLDRYFSRNAEKLQNDQEDLKNEDQETETETQADQVVTSEAETETETPETETQADQSEAVTADQSEAETETADQVVTSEAEAEADQVVTSEAEADQAFGKVETKKETAKEKRARLKLEKEQNKAVA